MHYISSSSKYFTKFKMSGEPVSWTITQALCELKTIDKRLNRLTSELTFLSCGTKNNQRKDDPINQSVSKYQQWRDLRSLRDRVKAAIVMSNATTMVNVGDSTLTVADAIERKTSIQIDKTMLDTMKTQRRNIVHTVDTNNKQAEQRLQRLLEQNFGKDNTKTDPASIQQTEDVFWVNNRWSTLDPLHLTETIETLEDYIETFDKNVDFALSESNSQTRINV